MPTASRCSAKPRPNCSASRAEIGMAPAMQNWIETYRGTVPPWECDVTEHFTIAYYFDRLEEAEPNLADALGLGERWRAGAFARRLDVRFARELRAGSSFQAEGAVLGIENGVRLVHRFTDSGLQAGAAIGMDAAFLEANRRGFSTFELGLQISGALRLDDPYLVETGIAHLGNSSLRLVHVMTDSRSGREVARLGQYGVNLDLDARRPAKFPDEIRTRAARLVIPTE